MPRLPSMSGSAFCPWVLGITGASKSSTWRGRCHFETTMSGGRSPEGMKLGLLCGALERVPLPVGWRWSGFRDPLPWVINGAAPELAAIRLRFATDLKRCQPATAGQGLLYPRVQQSHSKTPGAHYDWVVVDRPPRVSARHFRQDLEARLPPARAPAKRPHGS